MLRSGECLPGAEQFEKYRCRVTKKMRVQYDYRAPNGELFSCTGKTLEECQAKAVEWQKKREDWLLGRTS